MTPRVALRVVTNSELKTYRRCPREHHYSYGLGIRSAREAAPLRFGTMVHRALEAWWLAWPAGPEQLYSAALDALPLPIDADAFELARAAQMMRGYSLRWCNERFEVLHVEGQFRGPLVNPETGEVSGVLESGGKIDVIVRSLDDGLVYVIEHKTSSEDTSPGSDYWQVLRLDTQISTYYQGARSLGVEPAGVIYDVLGKPQLDPLKATPEDKRKYRKSDGGLYLNQRDRDEYVEEYEARVMNAIAEAPDRFYARATVVRLEDEERDAQWDAWQYTQAMLESERTQRFPRNPDACRRFGRLCTYHGVCTKTAELTDPDLFRHVTNTHEELTL